VAISTLVIGLGGTGVLTLRALKTLYQQLPVNERVPASFLAFDFDRTALVGHPTFTVSGEQHELGDLSDTEFYYLDSLGIQDLLRNLDRSENDHLAWAKILEWFPDRSHVQVPVSEVESNGASQLRVLGRLGFFLNDELIESTIRRALDQCPAEVGSASLSEKKRVILVSSIAGGTGAGMLIDMAYIARRQEGRPRVFAYLLLPEVFEDVDNGGRIFQNAYACLKELAYLKDQMIPFEADYYRIPPVDVRARGEEPFARIFLARGTGFSGTDAILDATALMASSILPQLHRIIQQKALAVVSNTLSPSTDGEQRRLRTHVFSSANSHFVRLQAAPPIAGTVFELLAQHLNKPEFLADLLRRDVRAAMVRAQGAEPGETSLSSEATQADAQRLLDSWRTRIKKQARQAAAQTQKELRTRLDGICKKALSHRASDLETAVKEVDDFAPVAFLEFTKPAYRDNIRLLKDFASFVEFEAGTREPTAASLRTVDIAMGDDPLRRQALYFHLKRMAQRLWVDFPRDDESAAGGDIAAAAAETKATAGELSPRDRLAAARRRLEQEAPTHWWQRLTRKAHRADLHRAAFVRTACQLEGEALADSHLVDNLENLYTVRAYVELKDRLDSGLQKMKQEVAPELGVWSNLPPAVPIPSDLSKLARSEEVLAFLRPNLSAILAEANTAAKPEDDPEVRRARLLAVIERWVEKTPGLDSQQYRLEGNAETIEDNIRAELVRTRQRVFERRTPSPQRKGYSLIMVPDGLQLPRSAASGEGGAGASPGVAMRTFLTASTSQILSTRAQCVDYPGSRIWIYAEDLFNPPEHIFNLDEYFRRYNSQQHKELFHIDRRLLLNPAFKDINSETSSIVVYCGNKNCDCNISGQPRSQTLCPKCGRPIRTRCGNEGCTANDLDRPEHREAKQCHSCGGYNHAGWWRCCRHGKVAVDVPIDKARCPRCIAEYQRDPIAWPLDKISVRPDLEDAIDCPRCADRHAKEPSYEPYKIPPELLRFYRNGVNGHDLLTFRHLAHALHLPGEVRCPKCRTVLIPIDHNQRYDDCRAERARR
jgi:Tubulin like